MDDVRVDLLRISSLLLKRMWSCWFLLEMISNSYLSDLQLSMKCLGLELALPSLLEKGVSAPSELMTQVMVG